MSVIKGKKESTNARRRKTINGHIFIKMIVNGSNMLSNNIDYINELNVFPVPDGDTGTNMNMTMQSGVDEMLTHKSISLEEISKKLSRGLLMGARGNSGVILSQIFRGISRGFSGYEKANAVILAKALKAGVSASYKAVTSPVEGTILTVSREASEALDKKVTKEMYIDEALEIYLNEAKASLERTPELLEVLKKASVVDSGGAGLVAVIEGMLMMLKGEPVVKSKTVKTVNKTNVTEEFNIEFPFCTEFIIELSENNLDLTEDKVLKQLVKLGDSVVCVKDEEILKVHVHTNKPGDALNIGQKYGEIVTTKIENMSIQYKDIKEKKENKTLRNTFFERKKKSNYGIISVMSGEGIKKHFKDIGCNVIIDGGQTNNPSTKDFVKAIKEVNAEHVFIIPNNSNVMLSARQAAKMVKKVKVHVLPAKTIIQGNVSLASFDEELSFEENIEEMTNAIGNPITGEITYAVRDTEINNVSVNKNDFIAILENQIIFSSKDINEAVKFLCDKMIDKDSEIFTIFSGNDVDEESKFLISDLKSKHKNLEFEHIHGKQDIYSFIIGVE